MAESAYRDAVAEVGPGQTKLTEGWKVLGLDKGTATSIFEETKKLGFLSRQELFEKDEKDMKAAARAEEQAIKESSTTLKIIVLIIQTASHPEALLSNQEIRRNFSRLACE